MPQGQISESKVKTTIVMEKELKSSLELIRERRYAFFKQFNGKYSNRICKNKSK